MKKEIIDFLLKTYNVDIIINNYLTSIHKYDKRYFDEIKLSINFYIKNRIL